MGGIRYMEMCNIFNNRFQVRSKNKTHACSQYLVRVVLGSSILTRSSHIATPNSDILFRQTCNGRFLHPFVPPFRQKFTALNLAACEDVCICATGIVPPFEVFIAAEFRGKLDWRNSPTESTPCDSGRESISFAFSFSCSGQHRYTFKSAVKRLSFLC